MKIPSAVPGDRVFNRAMLNMLVMLVMVVLVGLDEKMAERFLPLYPGALGAGPNGYQVEP